MEILKSNSLNVKLVLMCVVDIFSKYAWAISWKDKKCITLTNAFQKILNESNRKPNKNWENESWVFTTDQWSYC